MTIKIGEKYELHNTPDNSRLYLKPKTSAVKLISVPLPGE